MNSPCQFVRETQGSVRSTLNRSVFVLILLALWTGCAGETTKRKPPVSEQEKAATAFREAEELRRSWETASELKSLEKYKTALRIWQRLDSKSDVAAALRGMGKAKLQLGEAESALGFFERALDRYQELGELAGQAVVLNDSGRAYADLGETSRSFDRHTQALQLAQESGLREDEATALRQMAVALNAWGEVEKAIDSIERAIALLRRLDAKDSLAAALRQSGRIHSQLGRMEKSFNRLREAMVIREAQGLVLHKAGILTEIGWNHHLQGESEKAISRLKEAANLYRSEGHPVPPGILDRMGSVYRKTERLDDALEAYRKALESMEGANPFRRVRTIVNLAELHIERGEPGKALDFSSEAIPLFEEGGDVNSLAHSLFLAASAERDLGKVAAAQSKLERVLEIVDSVRYKVYRQAFLDAYQSHNHLYYEAYLDLLMRRHEEQPTAGFDRLALAASERTRAQRLEEALATSSSQSPNPTTGDPRLAALRRQLLTGIDKKDRQRMEWIESRRPASELLKLDAKQQELVLELDRVQSQTRPVKRLPSEPLDPAQVQELLPDDSWLLYYTLGQEWGYVWKVTIDSIKSYKLAEAEKIETWARRCYKLLNQKQTPAIEAQAQNYLRRLSRELLMPFQDQLKDQRLVIVADAALQYIPFAALLGRDGQPLIRHHEISYVPSATTFSILQRRFNVPSLAEKDLALFADPVFSRHDVRLDDGAVSKAMPLADETTGAQRAARALGLNRLPRLRYSRQEGEAILSFFPNEKKRFHAFDFEANRKALLELDLGSYRILHFATHGLLHPRYPDLSGIVLSLFDESGQSQAGFLRSHDIAALELNADLVVLSACKTAMGKEIPGEGVIGLPQSFMQAGVPRVVVSLWSVSDPAAYELMQRFYRQMIRGNRRPPAALREAQLSMSDEDKWSSPFHWAAFVYLGKLDSGSVF